MPRPERVVYDLQPGQVWQWEGNDDVYYLISLLSKHSHGRRWSALCERTGMLSEPFFRFERNNGWKKLA